jgi:hypothetical protein
LHRDDQDLMARIAQEQSPTYIKAHAKVLGLVPADPKTVIVIVVPNLKPVDNRNTALASQPEGR